MGPAFLAFVGAALGQDESEPRFRVQTQFEYWYLTQSASSGSFGSPGAGIHGTYNFLRWPAQLDARLSFSYFFNFEGPPTSASMFELSAAALWRFLDEPRGEVPQPTLQAFHPYAGLGFGVGFMSLSDRALTSSTISRQADPSFGPDFIAGLVYDIDVKFQLSAEFLYRFRLDSDIVSRLGSVTARAPDNFSGLQLMLGASYRF